MSAGTTYLAQLLRINAQFTGQRQGYTHEIVTHWQFGPSGALSIPQLTTIQATFNSFFGALWNPQASATWSYIGATVTDQSSASGLQVTNTNFTAVPGTAGGQNVGEQVCWLVSLKEGPRYKGGHGRWYVPAVTNAVLQDDANITTIHTGVMQTALNTLMTNLANISAPNGGPVQPAVLHARQHAPGQGAANTRPLLNPYMTIPVNWVVNQLLATQRRRIRKAPHH